MAHPTNGTVPLFAMSNLVVSRYGGFDASALGYAGGLRGGNISNNVAYGPGISTNGQPGNNLANAGSSHGGQALDGYYGRAGPTYGDPNAPVQPGSGARAGWASGSANGPWGGGSIQIRATDTVWLSGALAADGKKGVASYGPPSSGGSIYITCQTFIGDEHAVLTANGGDAYRNSNALDGSGGGGGRIAVWRINDLSAGEMSVTVNGGAGSYFTEFKPSAPGTIVWGRLPAAGTIIRFR